MKKHFIVFLMLCLFAFACEQESINTNLTDQNYELTDRGMPCSLTQIPLYIPAPKSVEGQALNLDAKFPVTVSSGYEAANEVNINIEQIAYNVNGSPSESQIAYEGNNSYELSIDVRYTVNGMSQQESFSLCYWVEGEKLSWGCTDYCEYDNRENPDAINFRTIESLILP